MRIPTDEAGRKAHLEAMLEDFEAIYGVPLHGSTGRRKGKITEGRRHYVKTAYADGYKRSEISAVLGITVDNVFRLSKSPDPM